MKDFNQAVDTMRFKATEVSQAPTVPNSLFPGDQVLDWRKENSQRWDGPDRLISAKLLDFYVKSSQKLSAATRIIYCQEAYSWGLAWLTFAS